jgi:hypothetical protein
MLTVLKTAVMQNAVTTTLGKVRCRRSYLEYRSCEPITREAAIHGFQCATSELETI